MPERQFIEQETQIARYPFWSEKLLIRLPRACFTPLSKNLKPICEGIARLATAVLNVVRARNLN